MLLWILPLAMKAIVDPSKCTDALEENVKGLSQEVAERNKVFISHLLNSSKAEAALGEADQFSNLV